MGLLLPIPAFSFRMLVDVITTVVLVARIHCLEDQDFGFTGISCCRFLCVVSVLGWWASDSNKRAFGYMYSASHDVAPLNDLPWSFRKKRARRYTAKGEEH